LNLLKEKGVNSILDVGCGTAPVYDLIKKNEAYSFEYKGVDFSEGMISSCKYNFPEGNFQVEDMRHLDEEDNSWDCVLLMHALDHVDDYKVSIKEATRVAKKYVVIALWWPLDNREKLNDRNHFEVKPGDPDWEDTWLHAYTRELLDEEFKKNNLETICYNDNEIISEYGKIGTIFLLEKHVG